MVCLGLPSVLLWVLLRFSRCFSQFWLFFRSLSNRIHFLKIRLFLFSLSILHFVRFQEEKPVKNAKSCHLPALSAIRKTWSVKALSELRVPVSLIVSVTNTGSSSLFLVFWARQHPHVRFPVFSFFKMKKRTENIQCWCQNKFLFVSRSYWRMAC